jgi:hypothetical protein
MPRTKDQKDRNVGGNTRDKGKDTKGPSFSVKGFTSKDPANVARNRAGAAKYSTKSERMAASTRDTNVDRGAAQAAARAVRPAAAAPAPVPKAVAAPVPMPAMAATRAPVGYRPGIDPEFNYRAGTGAAPTSTMSPRPAMSATAAPMMTRVKPTITLAKGGKAPRKKK